MSTKKKYRNNSKRKLSRRSMKTGKEGHFLGAVAKLGVMAAGAIKSGQERKKAERASFAQTQRQQQRQRNLEIAQNRMESEAILSGYNPQGDDQMYFEKGGKSGIYIKPSKRGTFTAAASKRGKGVQEFASQVLSNKDNYSPAMVKKANFAQNASKWKHSDGGIRYEGGGYIPYPYQDQPGASINPTLFFEEGGSLLDVLNDSNVNEYYAYQNGGAVDVPGGELENIAPGAQMVKGDNPNLVDDVELGTNPGEPSAIVDNNEIIRDAIDEGGQPYKQIFSDEVLVPGESVSMAKKAKGYLKQLPKNLDSDQARHINSKLDDLFNMQQMLNGNSHGESFQFGGEINDDSFRTPQYKSDSTVNAEYLQRALLADDPEDLLSRKSDNPFTLGNTIKRDALARSQRQRGVYVGGDTSKMVRDPLAESYLEENRGPQFSDPENWKRFLSEASEGAVDEETLYGTQYPGVQYQYGGSSYYNEGMREEMMRVPYHRKRKISEMAEGGSLYYDKSSKPKRKKKSSSSSKGAKTLSGLQSHANPLWGKYSEERSKRRKTIDGGRSFNDEDEEFSKLTRKVDLPNPSIRSMHVSRNYHPKMKNGGKLYYGRPLNKKSLMLTLMS